MHVLSMHLTLRTTGGGLDRLTWQRDVGMLQPPGALQPQTAIVLGASVQKAPILINTTYLCQTEQITAPAPPDHCRPHPKTSSHYLTTRLQRLHTLSVQWYFCCERRIGEARPDYSVGPICFHLLAILYHTI